MNADIRTNMATSRARRRRMGAGLTALPLAVLALANPAGASSTNGPPGNNGTVKIDRLLFDDHPNNEPHVGCNFQVDFYGFDKGDLNGEVTFAVQPPTGKAKVLRTDTVPIGEDNNSGGGSEAGLDASREYDLSSYLVGLYPEHPQQGYHVKLTVNADGSQGADTKHKVFWVRDCKLPTTPPVTPTDNPTDNPTVNAADNPAVTATVLGETLTKPDVTAPATTVLGEQLVAPAPVGGVQTGGGGTSDGGNPLLPFAAALGFLALAGFVTPRLRWVG
jgi:hypothetical protein